MFPRNQARLLRCVLTLNCFFILSFSPSGLLGLLVRLGIPVPCQRGARVDFFSPILADIGDMQSVTGDLSTFSGHLLVRLIHI